MTEKWIRATKTGDREWEPFDFGFGFLMRPEAPTIFIDFQNSYISWASYFCFVFCFNLSSPPDTQSKNLWDLNTI